MKIKNKYNIGDYVWIGKYNPTCHKVEGLNVSIHSNYGIRIFYRLEGTPIDIIGFTEDECFLSKDECTQNKTYSAVKGTAIRLSNGFTRLCLIVIMILFYAPYLIIQIIYWIFTGREEPVTQHIMDKITDKLDI